jgi:hypothetical protein
MIQHVGRSWWAITHLDNDLKPVLRQNPRRELRASVCFPLVSLGERHRQQFVRATGKVAETVTYRALVAKMATAGGCPVLRD